ncbi:MAG TPA: PSD1 and planctomycete cytochrome C domain-containing protein, partial [Gemmataceae bacterium]
MSSLMCNSVPIGRIVVFAVAFWAPNAGAADAGAEARSVLAAKCVKCHGPAKQKGGLRFDSREGALGRGDSGAAAIVPKKSGESELIRRISAKDVKVRMPPGASGLTAAEIETLRKWIDAGAAGPAGAAPAARTEMVVTDDDRKHWAFLPLGRKVPVPAATRSNPIDAFVLARLGAKGLSFARPAEGRTLIRRVTFDVIGLPPAPEDVEAFVRAKDLDAAYESLVDRLLASPHYGERWGRHWLDVARYADSGGYESDFDRPNAHHYRDVVIKAFNTDLPFDEFVRRQLAGDEFAPDDPLSVAATGFLSAGPGESLPNNLLDEERRRLRAIELDDMVSTTGLAFLGLTIGCARCHDHKFDPVPARDYYRLTAALQSGNRAEVPLGTRAEIERTKRARIEWDKQRKAADETLKSWKDGQRTKVGPRLRASKVALLPISDAERKLLNDKPDSSEARRLGKKHEKALAIADDEVRKASDGAARKRWDELAAAAAAIRNREPRPRPAALAFKDAGPKPAASWLFRRGDFHDHAIPVELGFLTVLSRGKSPADYWQEARAAGDRTDTTYQRRALAAWITDADRGAGPLLARVIVNRIWQHHFGEGLVRTPNDFGSRGESPTHPELFEWLAADLVSQKWKLKRLHRMILLSAAYRQESAFDAQKAKVDSQNKLLWRMPPQRLEAEVLRDALLVVGGGLNREMYGPAFKPAIPPDAMVARNVQSPYPKEVPDGPAVRRRSVYMFHKRVIPYPLLQAFDAPDAQQCTGRRAITTVVPQALAILNDPFVRARASDFSARLLKKNGDDRAKCINQAYRLALSRPPTEKEMAAGIEFLMRQNKERSARQSKADPAE